MMMVINLAGCWRCTLMLLLSISSSPRSVKAVISSGDGDLSCDDFQRTAELIVSGSDCVTADNINFFKEALARQAISFCVQSPSGCGLSDPSSITDIDEPDVEVCVADSSTSRRRRAVTVVTTLEVDINDPDDRTRSLDGSSIVLIVNLVKDTIQTNSNFTVIEVSSIFDDDDDDDDLIYGYDVAHYATLVVGVVLCALLFLIFCILALVISIIGIMRMLNRNNQVRPMKIKPASDT